MDLIKMLQDAIRRVAEKPASDKAFEVKHLFTGEEWNQLNSKEKRQLGFLFSKEQREGRIPSLLRCENGKNRHNLYQKV